MFATHGKLLTVPGDSASPDQQWLQAPTSQRSLAPTQSPSYIFPPYHKSEKYNTPAVTTPALSTPSELHIQPHQ